MTLQFRRSEIREHGRGKIGRAKKYRAALRISLSNLRERIPLPRGKDEIARLAELLNEMFDRLEKSFEQVKQFTADFSHELRTPLSMVALHAEKVLKKPGLDQ